jgi:hypothetical protein
MSPYTPKEAAKRLCSVGDELRAHNIAPEDIKALHQIGERFQAHCARLERFRKRLRKWASQLTC